MTQKRCDARIRPIWLGVLRFDLIKNRPRVIDDAPSLCNNKPVDRGDAPIPARQAINCAQIRLSLWQMQDANFIEVGSASLVNQVGLPAVNCGGRFRGISKSKLVRNVLPSGLQVGFRFRP